MSSSSTKVCKNFKLSKKLGTGAFGQIYLAQNCSNSKQKYAAKLQDAFTKFPQLYFQAKIYKYLTSSGNVTGIPNVILLINIKVYAITTQGKYNVMLMDLLGKSLQDLFVQHNKIFTLKTTLMIVQQMVDRIQYLHEKQIIHRDIKPDNFLMGINNKSHIVYIVDLGLSKKYMKDRTARYASINTHIGVQQGRRDDIQSIGYVMMYFLRGILPWQNMKAKDTKQKYNMILQKKIATPADVLCKGFPTELAKFINYAKDLKFQQKPDYNYLRSLLNDAKKKSKIVTDHIYDWTLLDKQSNNSIQQKDIINSGNNNKVQKQKMNESLNKLQPSLQQQQKLIPNNKIGTTNNLASNNANNINSKYSNSMNKYPQTNVLSTNGNKVLQTTAMVTRASKNQTYNNINNPNNTTMLTSKSKIKTSTNFISNNNINNIQALGSKILGPKISVIKR